MRERAGDVEGARRLLEEAYVLSQPRGGRRPTSRGWTFTCGHAHGQDLTEVSGQVRRVLVAGPGSVSGRYPVGNSGRARVPATEPMPVPLELAALRNRESSA